MMRNDYRRALILLRSNAAGYSGHVRLERRTLMGSMYFLLQAPTECQTLRAALVGRGKDSYHACAIGEMQRDSRGQAVSTYNFDPRNICSRELEQYQLIVITCAGDENCEIVLYGNVCGHADLNWERVRTAVCGLYAGEIARDGGESAAGLPSADDVPSVPQAMEESARQGAVESQLPDLADAAQPDVKDNKSNDPEPEVHLPDLNSGSVQEMPAPDTVETETEEQFQTAGELLEMDMSLPWPESIEPLRSLFALSVPLENPPDEEYIYIAAAMPEDSGYAHCAVGVLAEDGAPVSVRYGLPAAWNAEPPAGLEEYSWVGDQNRGWWMIQVDLYGCNCG